MLDYIIDFTDIIMTAQLRIFEFLLEGYSTLAPIATDLIDEGEIYLTQYSQHFISVYDRMFNMNYTSLPNVMVFDNFIPFSNMYNVLSFAFDKIHMITEQLTNALGQGPFEAFEEMIKNVGSRLKETLYKSENMSDLLLGWKELLSGLQTKFTAV